MIPGNFASVAPQHKLRVCEICAAYLSIFDNDRRLADHFGGKMHLGYVRIREKIIQLKENASVRRKLRDESRDKEREERNKVRDDKDRARDEKETAPPSHHNSTPSDLITPFSPAPVDSLHN